MKAVLMSIRPEWCELIASGKKTVEVRKTIPRKFVHDRFYGGYITEPFKVYIYETTGHTATPWMDEDGHMIFHGRGEVIGEFVCDRILYWQHDWKPDVTHIADMSRMSCVSMDELLEYAKTATDPWHYLRIYGWHISERKIYDKPKELGEFRKPCVCRDDDGSCKYRNVDCPHIKFDFNPDYTVNIAECRDRMKRPPQSWCYVEEI